MKANTPMVGVIEHAKRMPNKLCFYQRDGICPECKGLESFKEMELCWHEEYTNPVWKGSEKAAAVKDMMDAIGGLEIYNQEALSVMNNVTERVFRKDALDEIFDPDNFMLRNMKPELFILSVDPQRGGKCDLGFTGLVYYPNDIILVSVFYCFFYFI